MSEQSQPVLTRRTFLASTAALAAATAGVYRPHAAHAAGATEFRLRAAPHKVRLLPDQYPETSIWCYDHRVPGPEIRVKQGERLRIIVENGLAEDTTVHWHSLRVPNAMDGVPHLTQKPIAPEGQFIYELKR
jgi:FtsP/CotA-like multicopper oxidase with cupredoxin domain